MKCPICDSEDIRRSRPQSSEYLDRYLLARKYFRCMECDNRWAEISFNPREDKLTIAIWAAIICACALSFLIILRGIL